MYGKNTVLEQSFPPGALTAASSLVLVLVHEYHLVP
jgi:hypothetical protein